MSVIKKETRVGKPAPAKQEKTSDHDGQQKIGRRANLVRNNLPSSADHHSEQHHRGTNSRSNANILTKHFPPRFDFFPQLRISRSLHGSGVPLAFRGRVSDSSSLTSLTTNEDVVHRFIGSNFGRYLKQVELDSILGMNIAITHIDSRNGLPGVIQSGRPLNDQAP